MGFVLDDHRTNHNSLLTAILPICFPIGKPILVLLPPQKSREAAMLENISYPLQSEPWASCHCPRATWKIEIRWRFDLCREASELDMIHCFNTKCGWFSFLYLKRFMVLLLFVVVCSRWLLLICMPECSTSSRLSSLNAELHVHSLRERQWSAAELGKIPKPLFSIFFRKKMFNVWQG